MSITNCVDGIVRYGKGIVLVERAHEPLGLALPGGHVNDDESLEQALGREVKEETGLSLRAVEQFRTYSAVDRDPRCRAISTVYAAEGYGRIRAASDAKEVLVMPLTQALDELRDRLVFDHYAMLQDYASARGANAVPTPRLAESPERQYYPHYVCFERDVETETKKRYGRNKLLYDHMQKKDNLVDATAFALEHMPASIVRPLDSPSVPEQFVPLLRNPLRPYAVVAEFKGKYTHSCYDGSSDELYNVDLVRCTQNELSAVVNRLAREKPSPKKIFFGLELKVV